jgi:cell wall-associated NlpC family hydrolase
VEANGYSFDIPSSSEWKEAVTPDSEVTAVKDMYRLYNPNSGEHFYTASLTERNYLVNVGWRAEGIGWTAPSKNELMIYRLYNPNAGDHHYTLSSVERDHLVSVGWRYEGVGWYSDASKTMAVYRAYNPNAVAGAHNFTTSKAEQDYLISVGWRDEGIAWYSSTPVLGRVEVKTDNYTISTGNVTKCYNTEGKMLKGVQKVNGNLYYFDTSTGILGKTTGLVTHDSGTYLVQSGGVLATGFQSVSNALKYFSKTTGQMVKSAFVYVSQGVFNWFDANGTQAKGTINLSGTSYTFDSTGKLTNHIDIVEQKFVTKKDDISYFVDANSGTNIRFYQYILDNYGNSTLKAMLTEAVKYESWPYVWAGKSPEYGFDCSGLVSYVAKTALGKNINPIMTSAEYLYSGYCTPVSQSDAKPGSLVFWYGTYGSSLNYITHVGIYVGNGWMFNAGDPIGFGRVDKVTNILGQTASYVFGNLK